MVPDPIECAVSDAGREKLEPPVIVAEGLVEAVELEEPEELEESTGGSEELGGTTLGGTAAVGTDRVGLTNDDVVLLLTLSRVSCLSLCETDGTYLV